ncbi:MAG TPA: hypothetical protein VNS58_06820 [Puia sp.]|nr:hypothetical protein [Puia sp.]
MCHPPDISEVEEEFEPVVQCGGERKRRKLSPAPVPPPVPPPPPPRIAVLVVQLVEVHTGNPVSGVTVTASGAGMNLGEKVTAGTGLADFGVVGDGTFYDVALKLTDADKLKFFAKAVAFPGVPAQAPGSPPFKIEVIPHSLSIVSVDPQFAPGAENLDIKYNVSGLEGHNLLLEISSDKYPNKLVYRVELIGDQKKDGNNKVVNYDGKANQTGPLENKYLSPQFSPYKVVLRVYGAGGLKDEKQTKVDIDRLDIEVDASGNKIFSNDPDTGIKVERKVLVTSKLYIKAKNGGATLTPVELEIFYTCTPNGANTEAVKSYVDAGKALGKRNDVNALYWEKHPDNEGFSTDGFKLKCSAKRQAFNSRAEFGMVKTFFLPSGVGGDKFKIKSDALAYDGSTILASKETNEFEVWRHVTYKNIMEMQGFTHVSTNATTGKIAPTFNPAFVDYTAGARTELAAVYKVKYIGLWKDTTTPQQSWATLCQKLPAETPTPAELASANYAGADPARIAQCTTDRNKIIAKAQAWVNRIDTAYQTAQTKWIADAAIPINSLIGMDYFHPKYSTGGGDTITGAWNLYGAGTPAWLRVNTYSGSYHNIDPDQVWIQGGGQFAGLSVGDGRILIPKFLSATVIEDTVKHESGHATKSFFPRHDFIGTDGLDHSDSRAGLMYRTTGGGKTFTAEELKVLRGILT